MLCNPGFNVSGFFSDGEKDPRNLFLLFRIIPSILSNFDFTLFVEDIFEVMSCYFPIDFAPVSNVEYLRT